MESQLLWDKRQDWIAAFLTHHTQCVLVNGKASSNTDVLSGLPQGTVLGPLLFLLYINDIFTAINSPMGLFTDNSFMYHEIKSPADHLTLPGDINKLYELGEQWYMNFNVTKCVAMLLSTRKVLQPDYIMSSLQECHTWLSVWTWVFLFISFIYFFFWQLNLKC